MSLTFNSDKYRNLLAQYQSKLIVNEEENEKALALETLERAAKAVGKKVNIELVDIV
ncbi:hypothetical protein [Tolypothrix sp. PCC 7910]|uniref:hypothetical protein n=1 Tax=Tolypothrix sp. PCC 7910 TaxID=2099387 RepID=UPI001AD6850E|nr:hypothetical protein [Tolypothrix sp. PCC 7910]